MLLIKKAHWNVFKREFENQGLVVNVLYLPPCLVSGTRAQDPIC